MCVLAGSLFLFFRGFDIISWRTAGYLYLFAVAFSRIRLDILKDILKRTYAAEILFGIVLLIVSFSVVLSAIEPGIGDFGDALWYCFAIVTTIGFGDISAVSVPGRILSVILGIYGIIVNLPAIMKSIGEAAEAISPL